MKNKILLLLGIFLFSFAFVSSAYSGSGSGTEGDPFQVDNCLRLQEVGSYVTNDYYFIVVNDIDCSDTINWNGGSGFEPIGRQGMGGLQGYFDGQGYTISGLYINRPLEAMTGLFSYSETPYWIRNVGISGATITGGANTGGLVGQLGVDCLVENCYVGGIITGDNAVGGLVGWKDGGNLNYCFSSSSVSGNVGIGGLVGNHQNGAISNSYATGSITGMYDVGGLVGLGAGTFSNCYSTGAVSGSSDVGGLVGRVFGTTCTNSFWDTETSGQETSACGTGATTYEMKTQGTYQGWTMDSITASETSYPYFQSIPMGGFYWVIDQIDDTEPTITYQSPENNFISEYTLVDFTCSAEDNVQVNSIELYIDGSSVENYPSNSYTWGAVELSEGEHTWDCYACDSANNCAFGELRTITIDLPTEAETPQAVNKFWDFDIISKQEMLPSDEEAPVTKVSIFSGIKNFFQNILNWFKGLFN